jgi:hypothetical protein
MFIQKSYNEGDIISFKLVNGDEVVAKLVKAETNKFVVNKPFTIVPSPQGIGLMQSLFSGDINNNIDLRHDHVLMHAPVVKEMEDHYLTTTTGIKTVSKGSIVI